MSPWGKGWWWKEEWEKKKKNANEADLAMYVFDDPKGD